MKLILKKLFALNMCIILGAISTIICVAADEVGEKLISGTTEIGGMHVEILVTEKADENTTIDTDNISTVLCQIGQTVSDTDGRYSINILGLETGKWYTAKVNVGNDIRRIEFYCATDDERLAVYQQIADVNKSDDNVLDAVKSIINNNADILNWDLTVLDMLENRTKAATEIIDMCAANKDGSSLETKFQNLMEKLYSEQLELNDRKATAFTEVNTKKWNRIKVVLSDYADVLKIYGYDESGFESLHPEVQTSVCQKLASKTYDDLTEFTKAANLAIKDEKTTSNTGGSSGNGGSGGGNNSSGGGKGSSSFGGLGGVAIEVGKPVFNDLKSVDWARESITYLYDRGIVSGIGEGKFAPDERVTREQFLKMLILSANLTDSNAVAEFSDVSESDWSYKYIASAYKLGVASGIGDGVFGKEANLTRQDAATFAYRVVKHLGIKCELPNDQTTFTDNDDIAEYALEAVNALNSLGVINGMGDGAFKPKETITRAQTAVMVHNLIKVISAKQ